MPKVTLVVSEEEKALWVASAHGELTSLADWIRRACAARAGLAEPPEPRHVAKVRVVDTDTGEDKTAEFVAGTAFPPERSFRPDPKVKK